MFRNLFTGLRIVRHKEAARSLEPGTGQAVSPLLKPYIEETFGPVKAVLHELASDGIHVDVYVIPPVEGTNYLTLVTSGMSGAPMKPPKGRERFKFLELVALLPPDWPLEETDLSREEYYWPIRCIKTLARFPHQHHTWLNIGHSIPNGNPVKAYAPDTQLCSSVLAPFLGRKELPRLKLEDGNWIDFLQVVPIYESEMRYLLKHGAVRLLTKLSPENAPIIVNPRRINCCV
ncbi:MAG TPA: suppressor of fused domain protein [Blastocatellia bacterium]|nr:suppressor of fused domain protein [Blastocatellia bacterium]